jgi:NAD(P)-dependent dehydrogenase (short-subunit alcohol dehydrogenase family)
MLSAAAISRLVVISGCGSRGIGLGIARQVLSMDEHCEVVVMARSLSRAQSVAEELGIRAHAVECDVTSDASCQAAAAAIHEMGGSDLLALVNNAGFAADLPWFPKPWPAEAAAATMDVNLFGAHRLTQALMPHLLASSDGRVVFVSSGGGRLNLKRMAEDRRQQLLDTDALSWDEIDQLARTFVAEYESAAEEQSAETDSCLETLELLPYMSPSGFWLQSCARAASEQKAQDAALPRLQPTPCLRSPRRRLLEGVPRRLLPGARTPRALAAVHHMLARMGEDRDELDVHGRRLPAQHRRGRRGARMARVRCSQRDHLRGLLHARPLGGLVGGGLTNVMMSSCSTTSDETADRTRPSSTRRRAPCSSKFVRLLSARTLKLCSPITKAQEWFRRKRSRHGTASAVARGPVGSDVGRTSPDSTHVSGDGPRWSAGRGWRAG